jgi:hypothetical protein
MRSSCEVDRRNFRTWRKIGSFGDAREASFMASMSPPTHAYSDEEASRSRRVRGGLE